MESIKQVVYLITPNCYLASLDIKDAFYSVPVYEAHKKYLKFMNVGYPYRFEVMPNGYLDAMRIFTKLLKPPFSHLRELGHSSVIYVDDSLLAAETYVECVNNITATKDLLEDLGFHIHPDKSIFVPTQKITFLGFDIDTVAMTISLTIQKKNKIKKLCSDLLKQHQPTIRQIACILGNIAASFEAVPYGKLHYRHLEQDKIKALKINKVNFDNKLDLSQEAKEDLHWWEQNIIQATASLHPFPDIDLTIYTDASMEGWGANIGTNNTINSRWTSLEQSMHINELELLAILYALKSFLPAYAGALHVRIMTDNTTAVTYINKQGGTHSISCNKITIDIWSICQKYQCHLSAAHIPGIHNTLADIASRKFQDSAEWMLKPNCLRKISDIFGTPEIDLFASRLNKQLDVYASWMPDPDSTIIDAVSISWRNKYTGCVKKKRP